MSLLGKTIHLVRDLKNIAFKKNKSPNKKTFRSYDLEKAVQNPYNRSTILKPVTMNVLDIVHETKDAISVILQRQDGQDVQFTPGMFFTVIVEIAGTEYRRAYSISSSYLERKTVTITIKRIQSGLVSNWIFENIAAGSVLKVLGPSGQFTLFPEKNHERSLLLIAGGSGITPLMSITKSILAMEPQSQIFLLYGNRAVDDIIFFEDLTQLQKLYQGRLFVRHVLENSSEANFETGTGRLDHDTFKSEFFKILKRAPLESLTFYLCGPEPMMDGVQLVLKEQGVAEKCVHRERFTPAPHVVARTHYKPQEITIRTDGKTWKGTAKPGETLLEAGLAMSADLVFSCVMGGCGRCRVKVINGDVELEEPNCLLPEEKNQRYALACISRPLTSVEFEIATPAAPK